MENKCLVCKQDDVNCPCKKKGRKILLLVVVFLAIYFGIIYAAKIYSSYTSPRAITVSGTGDVSAVPDISIISFTVRSSDTNGDTQKLQSDLASITGNVFPKLKALGIDEKDIETTNYSVNPKYCQNWERGGILHLPTPCNQNQITGYEASETVNVKVRNIANVSKVLSTLADSKITEVSGPNFQIDNPEKLKAEARSKAIIDAKAKAKVLAKSLGVKLDKIISFSEDNNGGYYPMMMKASSMDSVGSSAMPNIATGEQKITSNISITFEIDN